MTTALSHHDDCFVSDAIVDGRRVVGHRGRDTYLLFSPAQLALWESLRTGAVRDVVASIDPSQRAAALRFATELREREFLVAPGQTEGAPRHRGQGFRLLPRQLGFDIDFALPPWLGGAVSRLARTPLFGWIGMVGQLALVVAAFARTPLPKARPQVAGPDALVLYALVLVVCVLHELGHALALARFGPAPRSVGLMGRYVILLGPYVRTTGAWAFPRRQRLAVSLAGPWANLVAASVLLLLEPDPHHPGVLTAAALFSLGAGLFNLSPFVARLDGYYVLCDLFATANWRARAWGLAADLVARRRRPGSLVARERVLLVVGFVQVAVLVAIAARLSSFAADRLGAPLVTTAAVVGWGYLVRSSPPTSHRLGAAAASLAVTAAMLLCAGNRWAQACQPSVGFVTGVAFGVCTSVVLASGTGPPRPVKAIVSAAALGAVASSGREGLALAAGAVLSIVVSRWIWSVRGTGGVRT